MQLAFGLTLSVIFSFRYLLQRFIYFLFCNLFLLLCCSDSNQKTHKFIWKVCDYSSWSSRTVPIYTRRCDVSHAVTLMLRNIVPRAPRVTLLCPLQKKERSWEWTLFYSTQFIKGALVVHWVARYGDFAVWKNITWVAPHSNQRYFSVQIKVI